ncbi:MAG: HAD family hydrolase [Bacillota bacterium]
MRALLLDLDGTILGLDLASFVPAYTRAAAEYFADVIPPARFIKELFRATSAMVADDDPQATNADVFARHFFPAIGKPAEELLPLFDRFYQEEFPKLKVEATLKPESHQLVNAAKGLGLRLVLATNPVFPRAAVEERLRWAGLDSGEFELITTYEDMHFCKPNPNYYREILALIGLEAAECLMAGNDSLEDMVAGDVGIATYLVTDHVIMHPKGRKPDRSGTLAELVAILPELLKGRGIMVS